MFRKLLKYDLRPMYRYLIFFYILSLLCATTGRLCSLLPENFLSIFVRELLIGTGAIGLPIGMVINNAMHIWGLTRQDFYGDQSYLRHTLPVSTFQLYCSKFVTTLITTFTTLVVIVGAILIAYGTPSFFTNLGELINFVGTGSFIRFAIECGLLIYLEFVFIIQAGITGIIIGHRFNNHKLLLSVAFGFVVYYVCNLLTLAIAIIYAFLNHDVYNVLFSNDRSLAIFEQLVIANTALYLIYSASQFWLSTKLLKRGIDVD